MSALFGRDKSTLHLAAQNGRLEIVIYLVKECHADVDRKDEHVKTPLCRAKKYYRHEVEKYLAEETPDDVKL